MCLPVAQPSSELAVSVVWQPQGQQEHGGNASADKAAAAAQHP